MPSTVTYSHQPKVVNTTSTKLLAKNSDRKYALLVNISDEVVFIKIGNTMSALLNEGIPVGPNRGFFEMSPHYGSLSQEDIYGVCETGGKLVLVTEAT